MMIASIGTVAHFVVAFACLLNAVVVFGVLRLVRVAELRALLVVFGVLLISGAAAHGTRVAVYWYPPLEALHVAFVSVSAVLLMVFGRMGYVMVQGGQTGAFIQRLRRAGLTEALRVLGLDCRDPKR